MESKTRAAGFGAEVKRGSARHLRALRPVLRRVLRPGAEVRTLGAATSTPPFARVDLIVAPTTPNVAFRPRERPIRCHVPQRRVTSPPTCRGAGVSVPCASPPRPAIGLRLSAGPSRGPVLRAARASSAPPTGTRAARSWRDAVRAVGRRGAGAPPSEASLDGGKWDVVNGWKVTRSSRPHQDVLALPDHCSARPPNTQTCPVCRGMPGTLRGQSPRGRVRGAPRSRSTAA